MVRLKSLSDYEPELTVLCFSALLVAFCKLVGASNQLLRAKGAVLKFLHIVASDLIEIYDPMLLR